MFLFAPVKRILALAMITASFIFAASLLGAALTYYWSGLYSDWTTFYVPFLLIIGFFIAFTILFIICLYIISLFIDPKREYLPSPKLLRFISDVAGFVCLLSRVKVVYSDLGHRLDPKARMMIAVNLLSHFHFLVLLKSLPSLPIVSVGKKAIASFPIAGPFLAKSGFLYITQNSLRDGPRQIKKGAEYIEKGLCCVAIAPEGTRNRHFPEPALLPFHPGSFELAKESGSPIACFCIQNTNAIRHRFPFFSTKVYLDLVEVVAPSQIADLSLSEISEHCFSKMSSHLQEKMARVYHVKEEAAMKRQ